ncbi:MAG: glutamine-hydrolyzing carbamoyl-phosphate synthase small subunit [Promethearchaeati archaeon]
MIYKTENPAILMLEDGSYYEGIGIGAMKKIIGELTFSTIPGSGYIESLTDSAYMDEILLFTYPSIGNYGVPQKERDNYGILKHFESESIKVKGVVMNEYCKNPSHYESIRTLEEWLLEENIPAIQWIDTRLLTQKLVEETQAFALLQVLDHQKQPDLKKLRLELQNFSAQADKFPVSKVSTDNIQKYSPTDPIGKVVILDLGTKNNIIRTLISKELEVIKVPYLYNFDKIMELNPDGVILPNGPGDPKILNAPINLTRELIDHNIPTMGIGLGNMIVGLAADMEVYKMSADHRGGRTTVESSTNHCYITFQNHGYCLNYKKSKNFNELYFDKDDKSNEGLIHKSKPIFSVAFNPEGAPGALDIKEKTFNQFINFMEV